MAAVDSKLVVDGYGPFVRACNRSGAASKVAVREALKGVGEPVRASAARLLAPYSTRSAAGLKVRATATSIKVEQSLRKTTGQHPEYGALQMRKALLPARSENDDLTRRKFEEAMDTVITIFNA